jgi:bifunctional DNA-binding transcriptional regulator/antitoxin component of YhaV-PrlF toxin-antitoxin module
LGDRGQVVIPSKPKRPQIKPGDLLLVMAGNNKRVIVIVKADATREFANKIIMA